MAVQARYFPGARTQSPAPTSPSLSASTHLRERLWNLLPLALSLSIVSSVFWAPYYAPTALAVGIVAFFAYWLIRSYSVVIACVIGLRRIREAEATNWVAKYCEWLPGHAGAAEWAWPRHMVIIPNYKESEEGLSRTLDALAAQANADQVIIVLAMEAREQGARAKAARLLMRYGANFAEMFATYHPAGLPGETPGKGSSASSKTAGTTSTVTPSRAATPMPSSIRAIFSRSTTFSSPPATRIAHSGSRRFSTRTTSGISRRRCAFPTAFQASTACPTSSFRAASNSRLRATR
jgi:hypothetical protein